MQASGLLQAQAGGKLQADGTISGEQDIRLSSNADTVVNGKTVANGLLNIKAGTDLSVGKNGLAQGSGNLFLSPARTCASPARPAPPRQPPRKAARAPRPARHLRDGHGHGQLAGQPVGAAAHERGRHRHRAERRSDHASRRRPEGGRERALAVLDAKAGGDIDSDGTLAAGGALALAATGARLGGTIAALGESGDGTEPSGCRAGPGLLAQDKCRQADASSVPASGDLSVSGGRPDHRKAPRCRQPGLERQRRPRAERLAASVRDLTWPPRVMRA